ncbi:hypothetical protein [Saccharicrinis fermentans]|uniref:Uncharacterized protein n=1 Tax=Saccharicrinis fermentans DSM 9555 = JCM 21142 TaxID=869213 RepID=W7YMG5_9BACT|nr:hypothetical protein [Saccharicrinis fermentans]GAF05861.1 hypothetical protein JCM21142_114617 [Saccharicrinis fermentans DSM 9555 = JCM 21142]
MRRLLLIYIVVSICLVCSAQQTNSFDAFLQKIPKLYCPVDTRQYDSLFIKDFYSDGNLSLSFNYEEIKKKTVYMSYSFNIEELNRPYDFDKDNMALICPLGYIDGENYKIILFLNDEYRDEDYVAITAVFYNNEGEFLFGDEESSKLECRKAHYSEWGYYQYYNIIESPTKLIQYGSGDDGKDKIVTTIYNEGFHNEEIELDE